MAASSTRNSTSVKGGNSRSTTPLKKNDPPQRIESRPRSDQSRASIRLSLEGIASLIWRPELPPSAKPRQLPPDSRKECAAYFGRHTNSIILLGFSSLAGEEGSTPYFQAKD